VAKSLFWLSDEAWKSLSPHLLPRRPGLAARRRPHGHLGHPGLEDRLSIAWRSAIEGRPLPEYSAENSLESADTASFTMPRMAEADGPNQRFEIDIAEKQSRPLGPVPHPLACANAQGDRVTHNSARAGTFQRPAGQPSFASVGIRRVYH
jgi:hypothetical protein